jgi:hypothetical protein
VEGFERSQALFVQVGAGLAAAEADGQSPAQLEERLAGQGRELQRQLLQDHRCGLATVFGQVTVARMAYRAPGARNLCPADAVKRQLEELTQAAAVDIEAFYAARRPKPAGAERLLVMSFDGKGVVMIPSALREATAKAAKRAARKLPTRLSPGEKNGRNRMAGADACANYLSAKKPYLGYDTALAEGWPIATGVIEGAARHLVKDRMDITGARWSLAGAGAVLRLRAVVANGDFETYWTFHLQQEHDRVHWRRYRHHRDEFIVAA